MLWSEQLSSSLISQSLKLLSSRLLKTVKCGLLLPPRLWNVVRSPSSFMMCRSLLFEYSSSVLLLEFVWLSCYTVHLEYVCMYVCTYVCMYVRMYVCVYVCMSICLPVLLRDLYLTSHNTYRRQTSTTLTGFEPAVPASEQQQTARLLGLAVVYIFVYVLICHHFESKMNLQEVGWGGVHELD
jgi:hypothetical protein